MDYFQQQNNLVLAVYFNLQPYLNHSHIYFTNSLNCKNNVDFFFLKEKIY